MIGLLDGTVTDGCVLTGCGVGYVVSTPQPLIEGDHVRLLVHHVISENAQTLYGFADAATRDVFVALTRVQGVAGKTALALLADVGVAGIARAVAGGDAKALSAAKGVGPKLATKIIGMVNLPDLDVDTTGGPAADGDELVAAMEALGYARDQAVAAATRARTDTARLDVGTDQLLKVALAHARAA